MKRNSNWKRSTSLVNEGTEDSNTPSNRANDIWRRKLRNFSVDARSEDSNSSSTRANDNSWRKLRNSSVDARSEGFNTPFASARLQRAQSEFRGGRRKERFQNEPANARNEDPNTPSTSSRYQSAKSGFRGGRRQDTPQNERKNNIPQRSRQLSQFTFKYIESLLEKPLEEVMQKLSQNEFFFDFIGKKLSPDLTVLIVRLLSKFCDCCFLGIRIEILQRSLTSGFVDHLQSYITTIAVQTPKEKKFNSRYWNDPDSFWGNFMKFCSVLRNENPNFFVDNLLKVLKISLLNIPNIETMHQVHICDEIKDNMKSMIDGAEEILARYEKNRPRQKKEFTEDIEEEPPEDFHEISIFPTTLELTSTTKPFVRKNVIIGPYKDINHYLDVQFRLLREDFVGPLRKGIQGYLSGKGLRDIQDIKIHPKVQFLNPVTATEDYCVLLKFHFGGKLSNFKFEDSKKFMFGSLVCFTKDNFQSILFGRIVDRKMEHLKNGQVVIGFNNAEDLIYNVDYTMVECSIYFEPYYHVLKVLTQINEDNFPMKNYIVDVDKTIMKPNYGIPTIPYKIECDGQERMYHLFDPRSRFTFGDLNASQNDAFIAALTRRFSIIQGPPGTGKTHVGLKVARTLLKNSKVWCRQSPIMVICFTNHALDQFLEGLIGTTDKIIRIGGQSKNEKLAKFNLKEHARKMSPAVWRARDQVSSCLGVIKNVTDTLNTINRYDCILDFHMFASVIPNFHESWLADATDGDFLDWLLTESIPQNEDDKSLDIDKDESSLIQRFEGIQIDDSESTDSDEPKDETNQFDELLATVVSTHTKLLLDLNQLRHQIYDNAEYLNALEAKLEENQELVFEFLTLNMRNEKLRAAFEFVREKLNMASDKIPEAPAVDVRNSKYIPVADRWNLYFYWVDSLKKQLIEKYEERHSSYRRKFKVYNELRDMGNIEVLKEMKVIGMTTTSAARLHSTLQSLQCPIVIVEEAAEVLEAHIVSALTKSCQQLILIGDHQQLRPSTANYQIEKFYNLGVSLFERMVKNEVQCFTLDVQHRMRPEISALIKPTIYPNLRDHESVLTRPHIKGVEKCLYFIDHKFPEESNAGNSKKNSHEAKFLVHLARYLILNGYESEQITILAAYLGQMFEIQKEKRKVQLLENVRVSVLDNYQGEESDIILLSLVRNNENTIGFLSIENRVCVALSRARNGLYIMGNMTLLCNKSPLWVEIRKTLTGQEAVGSTLSLKCQNHNKITRVSTADNFSLVSEGGCDQICNFSLVCGHKCKMQCHILDGEHENYKCTEKCNRLLCDSDPGHICRKFCSEECGPCDYPKNVSLECGHAAVIQCHVNPEDYECLKEVEVILRCLHNATKHCYLDADKYKCQVPCDARLDCGHSCLRKCHVFDDPDHLKYKCPKPCDKFRVGCTNLLEDTHKCSNMCGAQCEPCKKVVRKARTVCPHYFDVPCNEDVDAIECSKPCKKKLNCGHLCQNKCEEPCSFCMKKVKKQIPGCNHVLQLPCSVEANRTLCDKKCPRVMTCGHVCGGICKIPCDPSKCRKMVEVAIPAKCGHIVKEVPCFVKTLYGEGGESVIQGLESYCTEPCTATLNCNPEDKHPCSGSCGSCNQGRIHKRCTKKCGRILICNHECTGFCRESCKPCSMKCSYKCKHSVCKKRCGDQCTTCKEQCNRKCEHQRCNKLCGKICSVPPCEEPCEKNLKCGHPCIGFCSEPCPPLCRICDKEKVEEVFFGTEDEEDARFILLNDCGHILESSGLKHWLDQDESAIQFKVCPRCRTKIFTTERFSDYIKKAVEEISAAKITGIGTKQKIDEKRAELIDKIEELRFPGDPRLRLQLSEYKKKLLNSLGILNDKGRVKIFNLIELNVVEIKYQLMERVFQIQKMPELGDLNESSIPHLRTQIDLILKNLLRDMDDITTTEIEDIQREINRLHRMIQILPLLRKNTNKEIMDLNNKINTLSQYDDEKDNIVKKTLNDLRKKCYLLDISETEKLEIVKAIGLSKGHWYKCPNGHPYAIADCGGAMQISKCADCGAPIGGESHRLLETNAVATFMDGATHSAWSEYQNMENYLL